MKNNDNEPLQKADKQEEDVQEFKPSSFSLVAVKIGNKCQEHITKVLKQKWYLLNNWYELNGDTLTKRADANFVRTLYGESISVSAIVGKNGAGKSSLMELIYRVVNNLSFCMMQGVKWPGAAPLMYIDGICSTLYFESEGVLGSVQVDRFKVDFEWGAIEKSFRADKLKGRMEKEDFENLSLITRHFCYSLVSNYALLALYSGDYNRDKAYFLDRSQNGHWLDSLYNKNDGYTAAIGLEPYKGGGKIDLDRQRSLGRNRLVAMLLDTHNRQVELFDGYKYHNIELTFDNTFLTRKTNGSDVDTAHGGRHPEKEFINIFSDKKTFASVIIRSLGFEHINPNDPIAVMAAAYLADKTLQIADTYPKYQNEFGVVGKERYFARNTDTFDNKRNAKLLEEGKSLDNLIISELLLSHLATELKDEHTHIGLKWQQSYHLLEAINWHYKKEGEEWMCPSYKSYDEYMQIFNNSQFRERKIYDSLDTLIEYYPPSFYQPEIILRRVRVVGKNRKKVVEEVPLRSLSSGQTQFLHTVSTIVYHIRNVISVEDKGNSAKYYNVNLFLDEIEACFHPEYQQRFLKLFINMIKGQHLNDHCNINIIVATHSPFILSDIPKSNILFLEDGRESPDKDAITNPFCANVCDLLHQSFFLRNGFMGEWSKDMINDLLGYLKNGDCKREWTAATSKEAIEMVGEPMLKGALMNAYNKRFDQTEDDIIEWHKAELERLQKAKKHEENHN